MLLQLTGVRNQGYSTRSNQGCAAWVKHTRHPTRRSCKVSTSETYNQCNLYGTSTFGILLALQPWRSVNS